MIYWSYFNFCYFLSLLKGISLVSEVRDDKTVGIELNVNVNGEPVNVTEITPGMLKTYFQSYKWVMCQTPLSFIDTLKH